MFESLQARLFSHFFSLFLIPFLKKCADYTPLFFSSNKFTINSVNTKTVLGISFAAIFVLSMLSASVFAQDEKKTKKNNDPHINGNFEVGSGDTITITGAASHVNGNIEVDGGVLIIKNGAFVNGNIEMINGAVIFRDAEMNGNIKVDGGFLNIKNGASVDGNIEIKNGGTIILDGIIIHGNIEAKESVFVIIAGNTIYGNMEIIDPTGMCLELNNKVKGKNSGCP